MEENKKKEQKRIARECLRNFGLMDQVQEQFMAEDKLYYSERQNQIFDGILYWLSNKPEWLKKVQELEQEYGVLIMEKTKRKNLNRQDKKRFGDDDYFNGETA